MSGQLPVTVSTPYVSLSIPYRDSRDRIAVIDPETKELILWAEYSQAQTLIKNGEVDTIRRKNRIYALAVKKSAPKGPLKPTPLRQHGTMGDSHTNLRECRCGLCRENGKPIKEHQQRSTNPPGVWTIDALPHWGKGDWKTRALFRRPILEAIYGREHVENCLSRPPESQKKQSDNCARSRSASRLKAA